MEDVESSVELIFGTYKSIGDVLRMIKLQKHKIIEFFVSNKIIPRQQSFKVVWCASDRNPHSVFGITED